jgi:hypothetical protein
MQDFEAVEHRTLSRADVTFYFCENLLLIIGVNPGGWGSWWVWFLVFFAVKGMDENSGPPVFKPD